MKPAFKTPNKYPKIENIKCPVWARRKLGATVACEIFSIIYTYQSNGEQCYMSLKQFAFLAQCDVSSVVRAIIYLKGEEPKTDENRRIIKDENGNKVFKDNQVAVIEVSRRKNGESNLYKIKEEIIEQWIKDGDTE